MKLRDRFAVALLLPLAATSGCFDVRQVDLDLFVDDFDDGDLTPTSPRFETWQCLGDQIDGFDVRPAGGGSLGLACDFTLKTPQDGQVPAGAAVSTRALNGRAVDLSRYAQLIAAVTLTSGDPPLPSGTTVEIELGCDSAAPPATVNAIGADGGATDAGGRDLDGGATNADQHFGVSAGIAADQWKALPVDLVNFGQSPAQTHHIPGGLATCLGKIDSITFIVRPPFGKDVASRATLYLDNVSFHLAQKPP